MYTRYIVEVVVVVVVAVVVVARYGDGTVRGKCTFV